MATLDSDPDGRFSIAVLPGRNVLRLINVIGAPPRESASVNVTVEPGRYTSITVRFDSGIH